MEHYYSPYFSANPTQASLTAKFLFLVIVFGCLIIVRAFKKWNGGYKRCIQCCAKIPAVRLYFRSRPFCCFECVENYEAQMHHLAVERIRVMTPHRNEQRGAVLLEDALMYAAAALLGGGLYHYMFRIMFHVVTHVRHYAEFSGTPGGLF
jgi:hypothetical protein